MNHSQGSGFSMPSDLLQRHFEESLAAALDTLNHNAWHDSKAELRKSLHSVRRLFDLRKALTTVVSTEQQERAIPLYIVSGRFLREAYESLTQTQNEALVYVTGPEDGKDTFVLSRLVPFQLAQASRGHATPDPVSQMEALEGLSSEGQALLATFHSHPGHGASATHPSGTDLSTQGQLERLGYPTIGAIFSRNGFVRFYSKDRHFEVFVSGSGITKVEEHVFRITDTANSHKLNRRPS
jgi:hypothetical protein